MTKNDTTGIDKGLSLNQWPKQLLLSLVSIGVLWLYYIEEFGLTLANALAPLGVSKLLIHLVVLPITLTAFHLVSAGKKASGQAWFILLTWLLAMVLVFRPLDETFMAIISLIPALLTYVPISASLIYYRASKEERALLRKRLKRALPMFIRNVND